MIPNKDAKPIDSKIQQNEAQCDLEKQTLKILALSSRNISKLEFLTGGDVLIEKGNLEKVQQFKKLNILPQALNCKNNYIVREQYKKLNRVYKFVKNGNDANESSNK